MRRLSGPRRPLLAAAIAGALIAGLLPALGGAETAPALRAQAEALRSQSAAIDRRTNEALLELYAAESALARARREADALRARLAEVRAQEESAARQAAVLRSSLRASQQRVARALKTLYIEGEADPIAVVLGATSLEEALEGIEGLSLAAAENRRLAREARERGEQVEKIEQRLAERRRALTAAEEGAEAAVAEEERRASERASYLASLRREGELTRQQIGSLEQRAREAEQVSARITAPPAAPAVETSTEADEAVEPAASPPPPPVLPEPGGTRTLVVDAVAYHLPGRTASGLPVGPGIIAVDPRVIPLGTRVFVPGYGPAIAADTGSAIIGNIIDLWMPSTPRAREWGRRTVTITIYG